jgi:hypothetical protein
MRANSLRLWFAIDGVRAACAPCVARLGENEFCQNNLRCKSALSCEDGLRKARQAVEISPGDRNSNLSSGI